MPSRSLRIYFYTYSYLHWVTREVVVSLACKGDHCHKMIIIFFLFQDEKDMKWKFSRTRIWMYYVIEVSPLPPPFNLVPVEKIAFVIRWLTRRCGLKRVSRNKERTDIWIRTVLAFTLQIFKCTFVVCVLWNSIHLWVWVKTLYDNRPARRAYLSRYSACSKFIFGFANWSQFFHIEQRHRTQSQTVHFLVKK